MTDYQVEARLDNLDANVKHLSHAVKILLDMVNPVDDDETDAPEEAIEDDEIANLEAELEAKTEELNRLREANDDEASSKLDYNRRYRRDVLVQQFSQDLEAYVVTLTTDFKNVELMQARHFAKTLRDMTDAMTNMAGPDMRYHMSEMIHGLAKLFVNVTNLYIEGSDEDE